MISGPPETVDRARRLRRAMTLPEVLLWRELRQRPGGFKFRRQHPAGRYVLDFYCAAARLAIEVDGAAHDSIAAAQADERRDAVLAAYGVMTMRLPAQAILQELDGAVHGIVALCGRLMAKE